MGQFLIVTENNNLDLDDSLALVGVDSNKTITEIIEAASGSQIGNIDEHVLLLKGRFDRARIFKSAVQNGGTIITLNREEILAIAPFEREKKSQMGIRWLAILDQHTLVFGTPRMVEAALLRYGHNTLPDPVLLNHLRQLDSDVDSWSVLRLDPPGTGRLDPHLAFLQGMLQSADEFAIGIHYGRRPRICFAVQTHGEQGPRNDTIRAEFAAAGLASLQEFALRNDAEVGSIRGSFSVREKELGGWLLSLRSYQQFPIRH